MTRSPRQPQHDRPYIAAHRRAPGATAARPVRPAAADDVAMPSQDGAGSDDEPHRGEALDRQRPGQQRQPCPVRPCQPRMSPRPLTEGDRELMAQHEDLGVLPPRLPARQPEQRHRTGDNQEDQLQARKPKIIARPPACKPAASRHARALTLRPPRRIRPGSLRFQHPQERPAAAQGVVPRAAG